MKETGIVRRIDELGRIVIPKEIRRTLRIKEGDSLEIYTSSDGVTLKKFSTVKDLSEIAEKIASGTAEICGAHCLVADTDEIIVSSNGKLTSGTPISKELTYSVLERKCVSIGANSRERIFPIAENFLPTALYSAPVIVDGDVFGVVLAYSTKENARVSEEMRLSVNTAALILSRFI